MQGLVAKKTHRKHSSTESAFGTPARSSRRSHGLVEQFYFNPFFPSTKDSLVRFASQSTFVMTSFT